MTPSLLAFLAGLGLGCGLGFALVVVSLGQVRYMRQANRDLLDRFMVRNLAELSDVRAAERPPAETATTPMYLRDDTGLIEAVNNDGDGS